MWEITHQKGFNIVPHTVTTAISSNNKRWFSAYHMLCVRPWESEVECNLPLRSFSVICRERRKIFIQVPNLTKLLT